MCFSIKKRNYLSLCLSVLLFFALFSEKLFTEAKVDYLNNPSSGYLFLSPMEEFSKIFCYDHSLQIAHQSNYKYFLTSQLYDLKMLKNGNFVGHLVPGSQWLLFDNDFNVIDTISAPIRSQNDMHDIAFDENGNKVIIARNPLMMDLSTKVNGGKKNATVSNQMIYVLDSADKIIFQWSFLENIDLLNATEDINLSGVTIDPYHLNSVHIDLDNNYIISSRNLDAVIKINSLTKEIMWIMGGSKCKLNQFHFLNDSINGFVGFSHQHHVQRLENGNIIMFDNGNLKPDKLSRVVEYSIDEKNLTARKVWEYSPAEPVYSSSMGSVQRLHNGNTLIGWGGNKGGDHFRIATEVTKKGEVVLEIVGSEPIYRAFKYPYKMDFVTHEIVSSGIFDFNNNTYKTGISIEIGQVINIINMTIEKHRYSPHHIDFIDFGSCNPLPYRWIINNDNPDTLIIEFALDLNTINTNLKFEDLIILHRIKENEGQFRPYSTTYNPSNKHLTAMIPDRGEVMIAIDDFEPPTLSYPPKDAKDIPAKISFVWDEILEDVDFQFALATDSLFNNILIDTSNLKDKFIEVSVLKNEMTYFWRVKATSQDCRSSWSPTYSFSTSKGLSVETANNDLNITSHQTENSLFLRTRNNGSQYHYELYNLIGKAVMTGDLLFNQEFHEIDISELIAGVYILRVMSADKYSIFMINKN